MNNSQSMTTNIDTNYIKLESNNPQTNNVSSVKSIKIVLIISLIIALVSNICNYFVESNKEIISDMITGNCPEMPIIINSNKNTSRCGIYECNSNANIKTNNCIDFSGCTTDPNIITNSCIACTEDVDVKTLNCNSNGDYICNNSTSINTSNCGGANPTSCNLDPNVKTNNCSNPASFICSKNISKFTSNCKSEQYIKNPNKNTIFCSDAQNICNQDPSFEIDTSFANKTINKNKYVDVAKIPSSESICDQTKFVLKPNFFFWVFGEIPCFSYSSRVKNNIINYMQDGQKCNTNIGVSDDAITCGDCFENATDFQKAMNPLMECSQDIDIEYNFILVDYAKKNIQLDINECPISPDKNTCETCYPLHVIFDFYDYSNPILSKCGFTPYDKLKANKTIPLGSCTTTVNNSNLATTCGECYDNAILKEQVRGVLIECGLLQYDFRKANKTIPLGSCTTTVTNSNLVTNCYECYGLSNNKNDENYFNVLTECGMVYSHYDYIYIKINPINPNYKIYLNIEYKHYGSASYSSSILNDCPAFKYYNTTDFWYVQLINSSLCTSLNPYKLNNTLNNGECPFNNNASTCDDCYNAPNINDFQRDYDVIDKCSWNSTSLPCIQCNMYKYENISSKWDIKCIKEVVKCGDCDETALEYTKCAVFNEMTPCSQYGSCGTTNNITNTDQRCIISESLPCSSCSNTIQQNLLDLFSKDCKYQLPIACLNCTACQNASIGDTDNIPPECRENLIPCKDCPNCIANPLLTTPECQIITPITCYDCCNNGITINTPKECKSKIPISCGECNECISGNNIPTECGVNNTVACVNCPSCTSGFFVPPECAVNNTVSCSSCPSCMSGSNIPNECKVNKTIPCTSCNKALNLSECITHTPVFCNKCPSFANINECINTSTNIGFFIVNILLSLIGGINILFNLPKSIKIIYGSIMLISGFLIILGNLAGITLLNILSGNSLDTISGKIMGISHMLISAIIIATLFIK